MLKLCNGGGCGVDALFMATGEGICGINPFG